MQGFEEFARELKAQCEVLERKLEILAGMMPSNDTVGKSIVAKRAWVRSIVAQRIGLGSGGIDVRRMTRTGIASAIAACDDEIASLKRREP